MTKADMLDFAKSRLAVCTDFAEQAKTKKFDKEVVRVNAMMKDFYESVIPIIESSQVDHPKA